MRLGNELSLMTKPNLEHTKELLNLSDDEIVVFDCLAKRKSIYEISSRLNVSTRTVDRLIRRIKIKLNVLSKGQV